jgi:ribose 5-phosphate isomerase A
MTENVSGPKPEDLDRVAVEALAMVEPGMRLGLGTGRAAEAFIRKLGERARAGLDVVGVATSERSEKLAREVGVRTSSLDETPSLDIAFDGADEVSPELQLVKGLGGALLRERVVAYEAARFVILVTPEKLVERLGSRAPVPVEVTPFALAPAQRHLTRLGATPALRFGAAGARFITDNQNVIVDVTVAPLAEPKAFDAQVRAIPGVVDTGLFLDMASVVLVGEPGRVRRLDAAR